MDVTRDHMTQWLRYLPAPKPTGQGLAAASVAQRYRSIQAFFKFMVEVEGMETRPLQKLPQPKVPETNIPVIGVAELQRLMDSLKGPRFEDRRDRAIVSLLLDTGARLSEIAGLSLDDVDMDAQQITVLGKGRKHRSIGFVKPTKMDLQRYIMQRRQHEHADDQAMFLGRRGRFKGSGIHQMLQRRCREAGVPAVHAHQFRHTFAHHYLLSGGNEGDLMRDTGWSSRSMVDRYGRSAGAARAKVAHADHSPRHKVT
jgi:site-specific recombinase XerC